MQNIESHVLSLYKTFAFALTPPLPPPFFFVLLRYIDVQADWSRSWAYGRAPNARHNVGFFYVPVQALTRDQPFYTVIPTHRPN